jgi:hypothetical protein
MLGTKSACFGLRICVLQQNFVFFLLEDILKLQCFHQVTAKGTQSKVQIWNANADNAAVRMLASFSKPLLFYFLSVCRPCRLLLMSVSLSTFGKISDTPS